MKKIVYIGNNLSGLNNYATSLDFLSKLLRKNNFDVIIASNKQNKYLRLIDMCVTVFKNRKGTGCILIDTFSTTNFYFALIVSQLARLFHIKYIPILRGGNLPQRLSENRRFSNLIFTNSFINIAPSFYLKAAFDLKKIPTHFIPNGINLELYKYKKRKSIQPKLLWVRAFDSIYNPFMAIHVVAGLKELHPNVKLCMVGPDKDGSLELCKKLSKELNVIENIEFTGVLPKEKWIAKANNFDVFLNTTSIDNMPISVMEAMALGLPVISTNAGGMKYLIKDDNTGILVARNDSKAMQASVIKLIENSDKAIEIANNARLYIEKFDVNKVEQKWLKILNNV